MRALVLSGGGAKGAFQVGCMKSILNLEKNPRYVMYCGNSAGAINASFLAQYGDFSLGVRELEARWQSMGRDSVFKYSVVRPFTTNGLTNPDPLADTLCDAIDPDAIVRSKNLLRVGAVNLLDGTYVEATERSLNLLKWVRGSASYPILLPATELGDRLLSDGALLAHAPLSAAIKEGCTRIDVLSTMTYRLPVVSKDQLKRIPSMAARCLDVMLWSLWSRDFKKCLRINQQVAEGMAKPHHKHIDVRVFAPAEALPYDTQDFSRANHGEMISMGYYTQPQTLEEYIQEHPTS